MSPNWFCTSVLCAMGAAGSIAASCFLSSCGGDSSTTATREGGATDGTAVGEGSSDGTAGSQDTGGTTTDGGADGGADSAVGDSGGSTTDGASPDGGSPADSSTTDGGPSDGASPGPGMVQCGTSVCALASSYCCRMGLDPSLQNCVAADAGCSGSWSQCDKPSDCPAGENCVVAAGTNLGGFTTQCSPRAHWVVCTSDMDCQGGQHCMPQTCRFEGGVQSLSTCGGSLPCQ
jgi:hypothetical protein